VEKVPRIGRCEDKGLVAGKAFAALKDTHERVPGQWIASSLPAKSR